MAKQTILKERGTGEELYPHTLASLVHTADGGNADEAIGEAALKVFKKLWIEAVKSSCKPNVTYGGINDEGQPVLYDEVLTSWDEAISIYNISHKSPMATMTAGAYKGLFNSPRFLLPLRGQMHELSLKETFSGAKAVEVVGFDTWSEFNINPGTAAFSGCPQLRRIVGDFHSIYKSASLVGIFAGCAALREVHFWSNTSFSFADSPLLSLESIAHTLNRKGGTANDPITITVHADVYAKLTGDTTNAAAAALTAEELAQWQQVLTAATAKNISFATT